LAVITWLPPVADHFQHQRCCLPRKAPSSFCYSALHVFAYPPSRWSSGRLNPALSPLSFHVGAGSIIFDSRISWYDWTPNQIIQQIRSSPREENCTSGLLGLLPASKLCGQPGLGHKFKTLTNKNQPYQRKCYAR
jgi:hypothetical protein